MRHFNQRQSPRIDIRLQCRVTSPALSEPAGMTTENISRSGILVAWDTGPDGPLPEVGRLVTVDIELPAHHGFGRKCIHCQGVVVRVSRPESGLPRVALSVNYMKFRAFRESVSALARLEAAALGAWVS
jgi:c-di-GMP-binding flagellar brake protein YcgR